MAEKIPALRVRQWLPEWDCIQWDPTNHRAEPQKTFFVLSMKARDLKKLSDIYRRGESNAPSRSEDLGIQRRHDSTRSSKIKEFVKHGYPFCDLTQFQKNSGEHESLRKPGWLPTGIVINILTENQERQGKKVAEQDLINLNEVGTGSSFAELTLPLGFNETWTPTETAPIEVIDGQHRLWAFDENEFAPDFEMPVIAFVGLDISWQAYLFWSINISPVKINRSLAFDMYPLLRAEDWLDKLEGHKVYKEARAQEIVENLWAHPQSPWFHKIDMLAESGNPFVRQASWIRTLISTLIKPLDTLNKNGGLFGEIRNQKHEVLPWTRTQQAAFIICFGQTLQSAIEDSNDEWVESVRNAAGNQLFNERAVPGLFGKHTLLNTDQGIRALLWVLNDIFAANLDAWALFDWRPLEIENPDTDAALTYEIDNFKKTMIFKKFESLSNTLASFDWRTSSAPGLDELARTEKMALKGSGGYVELKRRLFMHISQSIAVDSDIRIAAENLLS